MRDYERIIGEKDLVLEDSIIEQDIERSEKWQDAYSIGMYLYNKSQNDSEKLLIKAYEQSFLLGLNIKADRECFLEATQIIARVYFQFCLYEKVINMLMILESYEEKLPSWVNLYYISAQIHTNGIINICQNPQRFFDRLDNVADNEKKDLEKKQYLYREFLNRVVDITKENDGLFVDVQSIIEKAEILNVEKTIECHSFKTFFKIEDEFYDDNLFENEAKNISITTNEVIENEVRNLNDKILELQNNLNKKNELIIEYEKKEKKYRGIEKEYLSKIKKLENQVYEQTEMIHRMRNEECLLKAKYESIESQLIGKKEVDKNLESAVLKIGKLELTIEELNKVIQQSKEEEEFYISQIDEYENQLFVVNNELNEANKDNYKLKAIIENYRLSTSIEPSCSKNSEIIEKNDNYASDKLIPRHKKILIIGGTETKEKDLRGKIKKMGFGFQSNQLEFVLEYKSVIDYASRIKPWDGKYIGIIVGPCPHKVKDSDGYSSFIEKLKNEEGYPHIEEARDKSGTLKISKESLGIAMMKMHTYLQSII